MRGEHGTKRTISAYFAKLEREGVDVAACWAAMDDVIALWDVRSPGERGPAAAIPLAGGASWVHLDEGEHMSGHLLLAPRAGGPVQLYDIRRVACTLNRLAPKHCEFVLHLLAFLSLPLQGCGVLLFLLLDSVELFLQ